MSKKNPILDLPVWTREAMAVAQDWELERGNEGALIWTDLGPEMARMVCENPGIIGTLTEGVVEPRARAWAWAWSGAGSRTRAWARAWVGAGAWAWARAGARAGAMAGAGAGAMAGAKARAGAGTRLDSRTRTAAYAGNNYA